MPTDSELLERFKPRVLYDSLEAFFADSAAQMTDNPGNTLRAGPAGGNEGELIADASSQPPLSLDWLGPEHYPTGLPVGEGDRISIKGTDYRSQYVRLVAARPELSDRVYGYACPGKKPGSKWLQYWFFYFYDDPNLAARIGLHEGDWEMIQLRIPAGRDEPDIAVYAQHKSANLRDWRRVEKVEGSPDTPLVYSARGSHASYFEAGLYDTEAWFDIADGQGPRRDLKLEVIDDQSPPWAQWPGRWGDTEPGGGKLAWLMRLRWFAKIKKIQSSSPDGPCAHGQWREPDKFADKATERASSELRPSVPVRAERRGSRLRVSYRLEDEHAVAPGWLLVSIGAAGDLPPRSFTIDVREKREWRGYVPWLKLEADQSYEVSTSLVGTDNVATAAYPDTLRPESRRWRTTFLGAVGHFFARLFDSMGILRTRLPAALR